jgi:hypothetical protein
MAATTNPNDVRAPTKNGAPPYLRLALLNGYNLGALAGACALSAATGEPWIAACAAAAEAAWLLLAPESKALQRRVFDPMWSDSRRAEEEARLDEQIELLPDNEKARARALLEQRARIEGLARENPSFGSSLVKRELEKLGALVVDFVEIALVAARSDRYLATLDPVAIQSAMSSYAAQVAGHGARDPRREVAAKNLAVLERRLARRADLERAVGTARGQMDLIENTFRLLADEIVTMVSPSELGQRLDDLRIAVDAIRETVGEADPEAQEGEADPVVRASGGG